MSVDSEMRLTTLAQGGGCGCKLSASELGIVLSALVGSDGGQALDFGVDRREDAALISIGGTQLLFTVDFFTPVVDSPYDWGRIAAANALSDIYAMGGHPVVALNILAWPRDRLASGEAQEVLRGGRSAVSAANAVVAGGHSIDDPVPKYGLAVLGTVDGRGPLLNAGAKRGDALVLTKPLGVGTISTAIRRGAAGDGLVAAAIEVMAALNSTSAEQALRLGASACTDVTGFGLLGHLREMMQASSVAAEIDLESVPVIPGVRDLIAAGYSPTGAGRNEEVIAADVQWGETDDVDRRLLCDPQSSGGLLLAIDGATAEELVRALAERGVESSVVGRVIEGTPGRIAVVGKRLESRRKSISPVNAMVEQVAYYDARAAEDDAWYTGMGKWDRGAESNAAWFDAVAEARAELDALLPVGRALDVACGSGTWTAMLAAGAEEVTAVDGSPRMLAEARKRLAAFTNVEYVCENLVEFDTAQRYDLVVMAFWLSHLPVELTGDFWARASDWLAPGGRLFVVDHRATDETAGGGPGGRVVHWRTWEGIEYPVVKVPVEAVALRATVEGHGLRADLREVGELTMGLIDRADGH